MKKVKELNNKHGKISNTYNSLMSRNYKILESSAPINELFWKRMLNSNGMNNTEFKYLYYSELINQRIWPFKK